MRPHRPCRRRERSPAHHRPACRFPAAGRAAAGISPLLWRLPAAQSRPSPRQDSRGRRDRRLSCRAARRRCRGAADRRGRGSRCGKRHRSPWSGSRRTPPASRRRGKRARSPRRSPSRRTPGRCIGGHGVRHVGPLAIEDHRDVGRHRGANGGERFPAARPVLLPEGGVRLVAASRLRGGVDQPPAQVDCAFEAAGYVFRLRIEADAKQRLARSGGRTQLVEIVQCAIPGRIFRTSAARCALRQWAWAFLSRRRPAGAKRPAHRRCA